MLYSNIFGSLSVALKERQVQEILGMNKVSEKFGLALNRTEAEEIIEERNRALRSYGRVELSLEVTVKLAQSFCSSPFIRQEDYAAVLKDLQEIFYYLKNETEDAIGDDELISVMKDFFDNFSPQNNYNVRFGVRQPQTKNISPSNLIVPLAKFGKFYSSTIDLILTICYILKMKNNYREYSLRLLREKGEPDMRLSRKMEKIDISGKLTSLNDYLHGNEKIIAVFLFGSYGTSYQTTLSDVDFGLLAAVKLSFEEQLNIQANFSEVLREDDINIIFLNQSDLIIQYRVLSEGRLIFCRDKILLANYQESVVKRYCDFQIDLIRFYEDYDFGLREEFLHG